VALADDVDHGDLVLAADGSFTYTPDDGFSGDDAFTYIARDGRVDSAPATVTVTVATPVGPAPVAVDDLYRTPTRTDHVAAAPGLLRNDEAGADATTALVDGPAHGTVTVRADGSFTYDPVDTYKGEDSFTYRTRSGGRWSAPAKATITVGRPTNAAPAARPDAYDAQAGQRLLVSRPGVLADDVDPDGHRMTAVVVDDVDHGTLVLRLDGSFTYVADPGFRGTDRFTYSARDGFMGSVPTRVELHVTSAVDAFVDAAHRQLLGRPATAAEVERWVLAIEGGSETRTSFVRALTARREHAAIVVERTFTTYLDRPAQPAEVVEWTERLVDGLPVAELPIEVVASPAGLIGSAPTQPLLVDAAYDAFLDRLPTETERARAVRALQRGEGLESLVRTLHGSSAGRTRRISLVFDLVLGRRPTSAEAAVWLARFGTKDDRDLLIALTASDEYVTAAAAAAASRAEGGS